MWKVTSRFNAVGTSGAEYVIVEERDEEDGPVSQPLSSERRRYSLEDGRNLNAEKDGTFILQETDEVLKAVAPSAVPDADPH
jgi:hypothetical protein